MLYHLFESLDLPGKELMDTLLFRGVLAFVIALGVSLIFGGRIIKWIRKHQIGETIRDLGLEGQMSKKGTPTMGGVIILLAITVSVLLVCNLTNIYVLILLLTALWCGAIGFADDYIKVFKHDKNGMKGYVKILLQVILGGIVALTVCLDEDIVMRERVLPAESSVDMNLGTDSMDGSTELALDPEDLQDSFLTKSTKTTFPFIKNHEFDYNWLNPFKGGFGDFMKWAIYALIIVLVVFFGSNGTNLTDGLDGLAAGSSVISGIGITVLAILGASVAQADLYNVMYIPGSGEIAIFMCAFVGSLIGFLRYNIFPAHVFMGDTGSLALGGIMGVAMILIRKELLLPVLCGVFAVEGLSVIIQRYYFKYTKHRYGEGKRIFKMTPLHHHFQKEGIPALIQWPGHAIKETKIVASFWLAGVVCVIATLLLVML